MLFVLTMLSSANAERMIRCDPIVVGDTRPALGQTGVPIDARLVALFDGSCGASEAYWVELLASDGEVLISERQTLSDRAATSLLTLTPEAGLQANTDYVLRVTPSDGWEMSEVGFTTGEGLVAGLGDGVPALSVEEAWSQRSGGQWRVSGTVRVIAAPDPDGLSLIRWVRPGSDYLAELGDFAEAAAPDAAGVVEVSDGQIAAGGPRSCALRWSRSTVAASRPSPWRSAPRWSAEAAAPPAAPGLVAAALALLGLRRRARR
ncbi:MAG: Ig-like domain-containing protein [Deltaproteobacteria bacterium]|nr:Ig-like domain-containing protein [Deltaproteobacteria bacterium]